MASSTSKQLIVGVGIGVCLVAAVVAGLFFLNANDQNRPGAEVNLGLDSTAIDTNTDNNSPSRSDPVPIEESTSLSLESNDFEHEWNSLVSDTLDDASQLDFLTQIAKDWLARDGFEVLSRITDSLEKSASDGTLDTVVAAVIGQEYQKAFEYSLSLTADEQSILSSAIVQVWARSNPEQALVAMSEVEDISLRVALEQVVLESWAAKDPHTLLERINLLPEKLRLFAIDSAILEIARTEPMDAINQLDTVHSYLTDTATIDAKIIEIWSDLDPEAALTWVMSKQGPKHAYRGEHLVGVVLRHLVQKDPHRALQIALNQPIENEGRPLEAYVLNLIANDVDVEVAISMLPQIGEEHRVAAYQGIGLSLVRNADSDKVLELAHDLSETEQMDYFRPVISTWAVFQAQNLFESIEQLPSGGAKSLAAMELIVHHRSRSHLTDEQIDSLRSLLNEGDATIVAEREELWEE